MRTTTINIIGDGSIGHLWAAYFFNSQISFDLYGRTAKPLDTYQLSSPNKKFAYQTSVKLLKDFRRANLTIICVKAYTLESVCMQLISLSHSPEVILLMMNGMGLVEIAKKHLTSVSIYHASITHGANLSGLLLEHTGKGTILIGDIDQLDDNKHSAIRSLIPILNQALPHTFWNENQQASLWRKLLINSIINPLSSLYRVKNGEISSNFKIHAHAKRLSKELAPVIEHYLPGQSWQVIFDEVLCVAEQTSNNRSSMLKDIEANRPTELDFINGYLLQRAAQLGCKLEAHLELYEQMRTIRGNSSE